MALSNLTDPEQATAALTEWLAGRMPAAIGVRVHDLEIPSSSGLSKETILFDASWTEDGREHHERLVARVDPPTNTVFPDYDFGIEFRVMNALDDRTDVPVPRIDFYEEDPSVLGGAFIVMGRVDGRVPSDDPPFTATGWVLELDPAEQGRLCENGLAALAAVHRADWRALGLGELAEVDGLAPGLDQQLAYWQNTFEWAAEGEANPTVEAGFEWVREHRPAETEAPVLCWGDARIGNMIFDQNLAVGAVLDWEMVTVGQPELDLGWWLFLLRHHTEGVGAPLPPGFPSREQTIARYEELSGHAVREIDYYETFSALRLAVLMHRAGNMMVAAGLLPPDAPMKLSNPASQLLAKLADLPAPEGAAQSFIGNR